MFPMIFSSEHYYTVASTGLKKKINRVFGSREAATKYMYEICTKKRLHIIEVYDDKHCKTYICENGVRFYINRM